MVSSKESAVIFIETEEIYSFNEALVCKFILNHYTPQDGDRIAMYKLGWKSVKDYLLFEWSPVGLPETLEHQVIFDKQDLPRDSTEIYQICYISSENVLHGATIPFQFQSEVQRIPSSPETCKLLVLNPCKEILRLRRNKRENERMSKSFTQLNSNNNETHKDCNKEIDALKLQIEQLRRTVAIQQNEINILKSREKRCGKTENKESEFTYDLGELEPIPPFPLNV